MHKGYNVNPEEEMWYLILSVENSEEDRNFGQFLQKTDTEFKDTLLGYYLGTKNRIAVWSSNITPRHIAKGM
jgi:hypothetical protein